MDIDEIEIEKPIGSILLDNKIPFTHTINGAYYHYSDVCTALKIAKTAGAEAKQKEILDKLKEIVNENGSVYFKYGNIINYFENTVK